MISIENKCKKPNNGKMYECSVGNEPLEIQRKCKYFEKASHRQECLYIRRFDFVHCGNYKAQSDRE
jgi:hypothetical protein